MSNHPTFEKIMAECNTGIADLKINTLALSFDQSISLDNLPVDERLGLYVGNYFGVEVQLMHIVELMGEVSVNTLVETGEYKLTVLPKDLFFKVFTKKQ